MKLSPAEIRSQKLTDEHFDSAVEQVRGNGCVVFESVIEPNLLQELREEFAAEFLGYISKTESNRGPNRYQMHLPFRLPFCHESVIANPLVLPVIRSLLNEDCICQYFASDTPLPGSEYQKVHMDYQHLFPDIPHQPISAYGLVLNLPLVDFTEQNGAVEIWPGGSHLIAPGVDIQRLAESMYSKRLLMPAGSLLLRDMRMWHRGTPNESDEPRPNLAFIYARNWLGTRYPKIRIPKETYDGLSEAARHLFRLEAITSGISDNPR
ncbi:MAG: phytanoyl-CoA dioxygenase family protein [Planctomycetota bacterium]|jgi:hypothetical protein|nr:phytanoyl-CoA dioxygenase family protein [Planctomycetota bacterium]